MLPLQPTNGHGVMCAMASDVEPYYERLKRLRQARGWTQLQLRDRVKPALEYDQVRALELKPGDPARGGRRPRWRYPSAEALEVLAGALGVDPSEFPEYRLAKARQLLDEREHGLVDALATLTQITDALRIAAVRSATEAERRAHSDLLHRSSPGEAQTPPEAEQRGS